jgi:aerobic carbon-monoxide dehydrogenase medium subunit
LTATAFAYHRPRTIGDVVDLLAEHGHDAALLAGGGSLGILLNERAARPEHVIDLNEVPELVGIDEDGDTIRLGAMTRIYEIEASELLWERSPLLPACARTVADPSLRHRVTVGGGLAYADPSGSLPTALLALEATVHVQGPRGGRELPMDDLFVGSHETTLAPDELITYVLVRVPRERTGTAWLDLDRRQLAYSLVSAAAAVQVSDGAIARARVAMAGIAPTPRRLRAVERGLEGNAADAAAVREAASAAAEEADPPHDIHAGADYRRKMAVEMAARAVLEAAARC